MQIRGKTCKLHIETTMLTGCCTLFNTKSNFTVFEVLSNFPYDYQFIHLSSCRCVGNNIMLLTKAFKKQFIIPNFAEFTEHIDKMYDSAQQQEAGQVSHLLTHVLIQHLLVLDGQTHTYFMPSCRLLITFLSWPSSALISGVCLCAQSMGRGTVASLIHVSILETSIICID